MYQESENNDSFYPTPEDDNEIPTVEETSQYNFHYEPVYQSPVKKQKNSAVKVIALALCCSLLGGIVGAGGTILGMRLLNKTDISFHDDTANVLEGIRENSVIDITEIETGKLMTAAEVYAQNVNSTVGITTSVTTNFWGYQTTTPASGSGFILSDDGYILTNHHVVESANTITVSLYNGKNFDAELIGYDESNDIAVLKVDAEGLTPVIIGDSDNLNVGDTVVAIGNPLGELTFSLTAGTISAKDRRITMSNGATMNLMQTDCAINSGNSGGALFNLYGEVIGITNAKYSTSSSSEASIDNIGFAIPVNDIREIVKSIIEKGYIVKPYIGVSVTNVSTEAQRYGLPQGAAVASISENSPAAASGLAVNDIITEVNGTPITGSSDLISTVGKAQVGDVFQLKIYRAGAYMDISLTVGEQIQSAIEEKPSSAQQSSGFFPWSGLIPGF